MLYFLFLKYKKVPLNDPFLVEAMLHYFSSNVTSHCDLEFSSRGKLLFCFCSRKDFSNEENTSE